MAFVVRCKHVGCTVMVSKSQLFCPTHIHERPAYLAQRAQYRPHQPTAQRQYHQRITNSDDHLARANFYRSVKWRRLRQQVLKRDHYLCQYCLAQGRVVTGNIADHIVPGQVAPELLTRFDNLATCCRACHQKKTAWEQSYYGTGYDQAGKPNQLKRVKFIKSVKNIVYNFNG